MSKFQSYLQYDNTSIPNFRNWAWGAGSTSTTYGIHQALEQLGFSQTSDQGQVVWNNITATITQVQASGGIATYTYTTLLPADPITTNRTLRVGMLVNAITCPTNSQFSIVAPGNAAPFPQGILILSVTPTTTTAGRFTVATSLSTQGPFSEAGTFSIPGISFPTAGFATDQLPVNNVAYNGSTTAGYTTTYLGYYASGTAYVPGNVVTFSPSGNTTPHNYINTTGVTGTAPTAVTGQGNWRFYNYEMWQTNDSISPTLFFKIEYANNGGVVSGTPAMFFTMGTATTGATVVSGSFGGSAINVTAPNTATFREEIGASAVQAAAQGALTFECDFYGGANGTSFSFLLWRNATINGTNAANVPTYIGMERSVDNTGTYIGTYMTLLKGNGPGGGTLGGTSNWLCEPLFPSGSTPGIGTRTDFVPTISIPDANTYPPQGTSSYQVGQNIAVLPCFPLIGYAANPFTLILGMKGNDIIEGATFTITLYGAPHTYMMTKQSMGAFFGGGLSNFGGAYAIRWE